MCTTSDVGTTIAMMEEVLNGDGSRSIVAAVIGINITEHIISYNGDYI